MVRFGTKCPSITSQCSTDAPPRSAVLRFGVGDSSALRLPPPAFVLFVTRFEFRFELTLFVALPLAFALFEFLFLFAFFFGLFALFELFAFDALDDSDAPPF